MGVENIADINARLGETFGTGVVLIEKTFFFSHRYQVQAPAQQRETVKRFVATWYRNAFGREIKWARDAASTTHAKPK